MLYYIVTKRLNYYNDKKMLYVDFEVDCTCSATIKATIISFPYIHIQLRDGLLPIKLIEPIKCRSA
jgi:hypothetical protein